MNNQEGNAEREELLQKLMEAIKSPGSTVSNEEIRKILSLTQTNVSKENIEPQSSIAEVLSDSSNDGNNDAAEEQPTTSTAVSGITNYPRRPGSDDMGREYEIKITALLSIRCAIMKDTKEMWLGSNVDKIGDFDDIVLFKQTLTDEHFAYMLQLKHQEKPKNITQHDLTYSTKTGKREKSKNDFSLAKYSKSFLNLMSLIEGSEENEIFRYLRRVKRIIFILYTNKGVNDCEFLENMIEDEVLNFLQTNNNPKNVYKFISNKLNYDPDFLQQLILFTNQTHLNGTDKLIKNEIKGFLIKSGVKEVDFKSITKKFVGFIKIWAKGFKQKDSKIFSTLTKGDILNKLIEIILEPYKIDFSKDNFSFFNSFWNGFVKDKTITVVDYDEVTLEFLKSFLGNEIKNYCTENKTSWFDHLSKQAQNLFWLNFPNYNPDQEEITLFDVYQTLWFNQKIPLLLKIDKVQDYQKIVNVLKLSNNKFRVVITKDKSNLIKTKNSRHFFTLNDLNHEEKGWIIQQPVKLQGRCSEILANLLNESIYAHLKSRDIIYILSKKFSVGNGYGNENNYFIQRSLSKVFLERDVLNQVPDELFLIENFNEDFKNVINSKEQLKKSDKRPIHHLVVYNEHYFEWIESKGSLNNIKKFQQQHLYKMHHLRNDKTNYSFNIENLWVPLEDILKINFWNKTTILSADPGTGKSILMDLLACQASLDQWVLKINLNEHEEYYKKITNSKASEHLINFFEETLKMQKCENEELTRAVFKTFLDKKKILVLLDGFDEISITYRDEVTKIAKTFHEEGYRMWITTRPVMKMHLEQAFNTFSISLKPFTPSDQEKCLKSYFNSINKGKNSILNDFVKELLEAAKINLFDHDCKFTGVPLQTQMLAEVFTKDYKNSLEKNAVIFNKKFDLLYLYEEFTKRKIDILCDKFGKDAERTRILFEENQVMFSLKTVFKNEYLKELNIDNKLDEYCQDKKHEKEMQFLQREGVMVLDQTKFKFNVNFIHQTFAEFSAGKWLAENFDNENETIKKTVKVLVGCRFKLFDCSRFIFMILDRILIKDCNKSYLDVINGKLDQIDLTEVNSKDKSGRTLLQLMALHGFYHPGAYYKPMTKIEDKISNLIENIPSNQITDIKDNILGYNVLDYALASDSLAVANKICEKTDLLLNIDLSIVKKSRYFTYCVVLEYKALFKVLVSYFASRDILVWNKSKRIIIESYCELVREQPKTKNFYDYIDGFGVETISELFKFKYKNSELPFGEYYFDLRFATVFGSINNVDFLLSQGLDLNQQDIDSNTILHYATTRGRLEAIQIFLSQGIEINKPGKDGNTALHIAAKIGNNEIVEELLIHGAEINKFNNSNDTPLHFAVRNGNLDTVHLLLLNGASSNVVTKYGETLLHFAAWEGSDDLVTEMLLRNPEGLNKKNNIGSTPLHVAVNNEHFNAVRLLLANGADCNIQDNAGNSVLHQAITTGDDYIITEVLNNSLIDLQNNKGETALHLSKNLDTTKLLLAKGACCNIKNLEGFPPLHHAIDRGDIDIVTELLNSGTEVNCLNIFHSTLLHSSTMLQHTEISNLLLAKGADVNIKDKNNVMPLHYACLSGAVSTVSEILSKGADINALTLYKYTPLHHALTRGHVEVAELLLSKGANCKTVTTQGYTPLHAAAGIGCNDLITEFLTRNMDINFQSQEGVTALHCAVTRGHPDTVKLLLDNSANINAKDIFHKTPLHVSVQKIAYHDIKLYEPQKTTVWILLDRGANVNAKDEDGNTALHYVCKDKCDFSYTDEHTEKILNYFYNDVAGVLLDKGADVNLKNDKGETSLDMAHKAKYESLIKILENNVKGGGLIMSNTCGSSTSS